MSSTPIATDQATRPRRLARGFSRKNRADIQAMRALAVMLVVINHLWGGRLEGGYVGVDVFFVISGYLITTHLMQEFERSGSIKLGRFYARRAKRLLPAALLVALASLAAAVALVPVALWRGIAEETFAASAYFENWLLAIKSVDYSAQNDAASTVQHYWSLSVEEQFYLIWPVFLLLVLLIAPKLGLKRRTAWTIAISLIAVATFAIAVWLTATDRSQAYFVTQTRVWEFAAGGLVSLFALRLGDRTAPAKFHGFLLASQWVGLGLVVASAFLFGNTTAFPGPFALIPVLGTCMMILAGTARPSLSTSPLLRTKPIQFLGDISYSLYLWHWPLIVLAPYFLKHDLRLIDRVAILLISIILAYLTKKFVEDPGRTKLFAKTPSWRVFVALAASVAIVGGISAGTAQLGTKIQDQQAEQLADFSTTDCFGALSLDPSRNCANPFGPLQVTNAGENEAPWFDAPECQAAIDPIMVRDRALLRICDFTKGATDAPEVWLVGDSHAEQWQTTVFELARTHGWRVSESLLGGCPFIDVERVAFMGEPITNPDVQELCVEWGQALTDRLAEEQPDLILVSAFGAGETIEDGTGRPQLDQYYDAVTERFSEWRESSGASIAVIRDAPLTLNHSTPECLASARDSPVDCANPRSDALLEDPIAAAAIAMADPAIGTVETSDLFCDETLCYAAIGGIGTYYDTDHISRSYAKSTVPFIDERLRSIVPSEIFAN